MINSQPKWVTQEEGSTNRTFGLQAERSEDRCVAGRRAGHGWVAGLGSEDWSEIRQLGASGSLLGLADGPFLQQQLWGPLSLSPQGLPSLTLQLPH